MQKNDGLSRRTGPETKKRLSLYYKVDRPQPRCELLHILRAIFRSWQKVLFWPLRERRFDFAIACQNKNQV
jgi:hypothetical protein